MDMTDAQERCIMLHLWKAQEDLPEKERVTTSDWDMARLNVDKSTASDIISTFKGGRADMALNQIKHLCQTHR